ncbi:MAG: YihA family ribosome biogenesis GTP-binding protein [Magnetococcales bacterium]|nr:YihA family ribosome biogenesis GTP-binding protein [Magnetococcales bacterium]
MTRSPHSSQTLPVEFVTSALKLSEFPPADLPEVAVVGRSNVGKSALLNRLFNRKKLVRVSRTPGCTRRINFFQVKERWWFVDLPGYGFAKVNRQEHRGWEQAIGDYLDHRRNLRAVLLLMDLRRGITDIDREMILFLEERGIPLLPVATKIDKLKPNARRQGIVQINKQLKPLAQFALMPVAATSSLKGDGIPELWKRIREVLGRGVGEGSETESPQEPSLETTHPE